MGDDGRPVLGQVNLVVGDMAASVEFYRRLGLEIPEPSMWAEHHRNAEVPDGSADLDLDSLTSASLWNQGAVPGRTRPVIGFRLPSRDAVDRTYAELTGAGHPGEQEPYDAFFGARYAIVLDPDGNPVGLMSPIDPERRTAPPPLPD